ncbi:MAG: hypothetical protein AAF367_18495 [Pseudomonadota bacterium]
MTNTIRSGLWADETGAVTVDWVALTAAVVVIGIGIAYAVFGPDGTSGINAVVTSLTDELAQAATNIDGSISSLSVPPPLSGGGS